MTETVLVAHPAPVIRVPRGARRTRLDFLRMRTPAVLHRIDRDAFAPLPDGAGRALDGLGLRDGRLWGRLDSGPEPGSIPMPAGAFRDFLRGEGLAADHPFHARLQAWFQRGPLVAVRGIAVVDGTPGSGAERGGEIDVGASRAIGHDGRAACARAAAAFVSEDCALVGDEVWTRLRPLARYNHDCTVHELSLLRHPFATVAGATFHLGLDRIERGVETFRNHWEPVPHRKEELSELLQALPPDYAQPDDLHYLANSLVPVYVRICGATQRHPPHGPSPVDPALRGAAYAAMTGGIGDAEAPGVLERLHGAVGSLLEGWPRHPEEFMLSRIRAHLDASVMPRLAGTAAEDAGDLAALAP